MKIEAMIKQLFESLIETPAGRRRAILIIAEWLHRKAVEASASTSEIIIIREFLGKLEYQTPESEEKCRGHIRRLRAGLETLHSVIMSEGEEFNR